MTTHGAAKGGRRTPEYNAWSAMRRRCLSPSCKAYPNYGGRGIQICHRWSSFANFLADMGKRPPGMTLERRNNNGNYTPRNCIWASYAAQGRNRRSTVLNIAKVRLIRRRLARGEGCTSIGRALSIHPSTVRNVADNHRWADVQ